LKLGDLVELAATHDEGLEDPGLFIVRRVWENAVRVYCIKSPKSSKDNNFTGPWFDYKTGHTYGGLTIWFRTVCFEKETQL
jgi:hypothetical protein